ncbi:MAG TPA: dihydroorotate dehydrogenase electron transfer subunit, partial [Thermoplasmatales archaeon]|nr:dihydroorotate dehydrogenase electron transfer subunit [Thermoplasmatales archaeon]
MNKPIVVTIEETKIENKDVKTLRFHYHRDVSPGQFFMIWIPGVDEIPLSSSFTRENLKGVTFKRVGEATRQLFKLDKGDKIGIRGPYGNGFKLFGEHILFVGGGTGIATITPAAEEALKMGIEATIILGVKTKDELFFEERLKENGAKVYIATDDGTRGYKGFASELAIKLLKEEEFSLIITCGPELMMKQLLLNRGDIPLQASLERYMKCGIGVCGHCCIGRGLRVCVDGPVFNHEVLEKLEEFGVYTRDASGRR